MPSSVVEHIKYDPEKKDLIVVFVSGDVYRYKDVPEKIYKNFKASISKGTFLNRTIKKKFEMEKIED
ncbi:KTSC domain-containing protein [Pedobacter boryungensis]|uniref:KTSC domain-containing protein n=1 Tax=Pedobacter boryungensis TaxID=869962 RepID=A0ABX2D9B3_9SPHI|nr:KTSC domain-containing protein [Pedobacter boryungensis]NQX30643.1 KTSC domain-containing protein [Pedobacter boryungensis]